MTSTKDTKRALIKQLARYKAESGSTYEELAEELGYSVPAINFWLNKTNLPSESSIDNIKIFLASKGLTTPTARLSDPTVSELLVNLRTTKDREGLTLVELAEKVGVSEHSLSNWFRGMSAPTALNAYHIRNFLAGRSKQTNLFEDLFEVQASQADMTLTAEDGTQYISSRTVAEWAEKQHNHLTRDIEKYISILENADLRSLKLENPDLDSLNLESSNLSFGSTVRVESYFMADSYQVEDNKRSYKFYWCSRKGCEMIANKMTGKKGVIFTAHYIETFHDMEQAIKETAPQTAEPIPEQTTAPQADISPEVAYIRSKLTDVMAETDLRQIYEDLWNIQNFVAMVKPLNIDDKK